MGYFFQNIFDSGQFFKVMGPEFFFVILHSVFSLILKKISKVVYTLKDIGYCTFANTLSLSIFQGHWSVWRSTFYFSLITLFWIIFHKHFFTLNYFSRSQVNLIFEGVVNYKKTKRYFVSFHYSSEILNFPITVLWFFNEVSVIQYAFIINCKGFKLMRNFHLLCWYKKNLCRGFKSQDSLSWCSQTLS